MADATVGEVYLVTAMGSWAGQRIMFTQTYRLDAVGPFVTHTLASATLLKYIRGGVGGLDAYESLYLALLPAQYTLDYWRAQCIRSVRYVPVDFNRGVPGTNAEDTEAGNQAAVLTLRTVLSGRNQVSNKHIGPLPQGVATQDDGLLTAGYKTLLSNFGTALLNSFSDLPTASTFTPCIYHGEPPLPEANQVTSFVVQDTIRTMRRRNLRAGI